MCRCRIFLLEAFFVHDSESEVAQICSYALLVLLALAHQLGLRLRLQQRLPLLQRTIRIRDLPYKSSPSDLPSDVTYSRPAAPIQNVLPGG
jgi:hypothetical protein